MPYVSHHFVGRERGGEEPPWGIEPSATGKDVKGGLLTTNQWMFQGVKGLPANPVRNHTTNHFDPQSWRDRSSYRETFFTPQAFSRHAINKASPNRNNRPHPRQISWPLEPHKRYMIWNPKADLTINEKPYSAPSLLRHYDENKWRTTTETTYQNYFRHKDKHNDEKKEEKTQSRLATRDQFTESRVQTRPSTFDVSASKNIQSMYRNQFNGDAGRPSTNARPIDYSWKNIRY